MYDDGCHYGDKGDEEDDDVPCLLHCYCLRSFPNDNRQSITISHLLEYAKFCNNLLRPSFENAQSYDDGCVDDADDQNANSYIIQQ